LEKDNLRNNFQPDSI